MTWKNTFKPLLVPVGTFGALIATGVILAFFSDKPWITVPNFVFAFAASSILLLNFARMALRKANPLHADAILLPVGETDVVGIQVFNPYTAAVAIKSVKLTIITGDGERREVLAEEGKAKELEKGFVEKHYDESASCFELGGKKNTRFHLNRNSERNCGDFLNLPDKTFWIEIECFSGAAIPVSGKKIQAAIRKSHRA